MGKELSLQAEQYLASVVAGGFYPSREAAIEAAVAALREQSERLATVPAEHMKGVEQAIASSIAGRSDPLTPADWTDLRQVACDAAGRGAQGSS